MEGSFRVDLYTEEEFAGLSIPDEDLAGWVMVYLEIGLSGKMIIGILRRLNASFASFSPKEQVMFMREVIRAFWTENDVAISRLWRIPTRKNIKNIIKP